MAHPEAANHYFTPINEFIIIISKNCSAGQFRRRMNLLEEQAMHQFTGKITLIVVLAIIGLLVGCAGPQNGRKSSDADVKEESLPGASTESPDTTQKPAAPPVQSDSGSGTADRAERIKFLYEDVYFKRGSTKLDTAAKGLLDKKALWLKANPDVKVVIEGHTDYKGSKEYNLALGDRRSGAVKSYLMGRGIERERLIAISYGKEKPAVTVKTEKDRAKNRRVHFVIEE
jgi:peptidoglycan-associated lipoprotein